MKKKRVLKIALVSALSSLALLSGAGFTVLRTNAENASVPLPQSNQTELNGTEPNETEHETLLIAPRTYEEHLPLTAPTGAAVCEEYTAIAEGNTIYYYDREAGEYYSYTHAEQGLHQDNVKNLQFCENGNLYFADNSSGDNFYELDLSTRTKTKIDDVACESFVIHGRDLYFASAVGTLYTTSLQDTASPKKPLLQGENNPSKPVLAFWNGELYFTDDGIRQTLYKIQPHIGIPTTVAQLEIRIKTMTINAGLLACTTSEGDFYTYTLPTLTKEGELTHIPQGGYTALSSFGEHVYATQTDKGVIRQYSTTDKAFTDFEICASSNAKNRLSGATRTVLAGDKLLIADDGNSRISVYDSNNNTFEEPIPTTLSAKFLASDGETALIVSGDEAALYSLTNTEKNPLATFNRFEGEIKGVTAVYGNYYLLTAGNAYSISASAENGEYVLTRARKNCASFVSPTLLTADVYGDLYVGTGNFVYRFSESDFMQTEAQGRVVVNNIPANTRELAVDYERNVYALSDGKLYKNGAKEPCADFTATALVFGGENYTPQPLSFAFGVEENAAYLLCDGNYLIRTDALSLPTVKTIPVGNARNEIFSENSAEISVAKIAKNALLVEFDMQTLGKAKTSDYFPYLSYKRSATQLTALKIGEIDGYAIVAVFNEPTNGYFTYLVREEFVSLLENADFEKVYGEAERKTGYLTSALPLYKFPYLTDLLLAHETLARGTELTLLGEINNLDYDYYHVAYQTAEGEKTGYIPKSYVQLFDGTLKQTQTYVQGATESNGDALWRLGYILLGFGAVCILLDYLILRKKRKDD